MIWTGKSNEKDFFAVSNVFLDEIFTLFQLIPARLPNLNWVLHMQARYQRDDGQYFQ